MADDSVRAIGAGLSQKGVRNHNERLILTLVQRHGALPGSDLARRSGLSAPTVSAILRSLEGDGLLLRGDPVRGRVGKPSVPIRLAPGGVFSWGIKIGRRSTDLLLMDFTGVIRGQMRLTYTFPRPAEIIAFVADGLCRISVGMTADEVARICGVGLAAPFEMWDWLDTLGAPVDLSAEWRQTDVAAEIGRISGLPVTLMNDATAACQAEHVYGRGRAFRDYAYFFVAAFVGGGVVLNHSVYEGRSRNAGALGSLRSIGPGGETVQLVDVASIHLLEAALARDGLDPQQLWSVPQDWSHLGVQVGPWIARTAQELAKASLSTCAVIDFEAVIVDGAFPAAVRDDLVAQTRAALCGHDLRGLIAPQIEAGTIGGNARAIGAASSPMFSQFLLDTNAGLR